MRTSTVATTVALLTVTCAAVVSGGQLDTELPPYFDSALDGVWVGTMEIRTAESSSVYPLLLNIDAADSTVGGVALLPDNLEGELASFAFFPLSGAIRANRLVAEVGVSPVVVPSGAPREPLRLNLRYRKGSLSGIVNASDLRRGDVELQQTSPEFPLQHVWVEELPAIRKDGPLALALFQGTEVTGIGSLGAETGRLIDATFDGEHLDATLRLPSGDRVLAMTLQGGRLRGSVAGARVDTVDLYPGGVRTEPAVTRFTPASVRVDRSTTVDVIGRNLAPGFMLHFADPGVSGGIPKVLDARTARVAVAVAASLLPGTEVAAFVVGADGAAREAGGKVLLEPAAPISFAADLVPILVQSCATSGCHVTPSPDPETNTLNAPGSLILEAVAAYDNLVSRPSVERTDLLRVAPGSPDTSYLIMKLLGSEGIIGERMPMNPPYFSDATVAMFASWIRAGAPRN